jgi:nucleotide-binding universal stress UspA family protein
VTEERYEYYRAQIIAYLRGLLGRLDTIEGDRRAMKDGLLSVLVCIHDKLEIRVFSNAETVRDAPFPGGGMDVCEARRLLQLLDQYESSVRKIRFPHQMDPEVLKVSTSVPLLQAADISAPQVMQSPSERFREQIAQAADELRGRADAWPKLQRDAKSWNPADFLCDLIVRVVPASRLTEIEAFLQLPDMRTGVWRAVQEGKVSNLLDSLNVDELLAIERLAISEVGGTHGVPASTKEALYDSIMTNVGLLPTSAAVVGSTSEVATDILAKKIKSNEFDVFLAHNSADKEKVLKLGKMLRAEGIYPWIDIEQIPPGRWFQDIIQSAVRKVKVAAIIIGARGIDRWQALELRSFLSECVEASLPVIPVLLPGVDAFPDNLIFLRELNYVKFETEVTEREGVQRLAWGISGKKPDA